MEYVFAAVSIASAATGAAVSYNAQKSSADLASATAEYDALLQERQARIAQRNTELQATVNQAALRSDEQQQLNQAAALEKHAEAQRSAGREATRRARLNGARLQARQRARLAGSGFINEGTPLDLLAEAAGNIQLELNDQQYAADLDATKTLNQASLVRRGASQTGFQASLTRLDQDAAATRTRAELRNAELTRLTGTSTAAGLNNSATASLLTGFTNTATKTYDAYDAGLFTAA
jgi:hypothetical protein